MWGSGKHIVLGWVMTCSVPVLLSLGRGCCIVLSILRSESTCFTNLVSWEVPYSSLAPPESQCNLISQPSSRFGQRLKRNWVQARTSSLSAIIFIVSYRSSTSLIKYNELNGIMSHQDRVYLLSYPCRLLLSRVSLHIAHASKVLSIPVARVRIPMMRFIFVSEERLRESTIEKKFTN